ncbi:MAG: thioredoxin family protein [Gemmatimonadota bacterium]|nr:MAG: thioredoxin family protein [Gemmatimonadota bacterium]
MRRVPATISVPGRTVLAIAVLFAALAQPVLAQRQPTYRGRPAVNVRAVPSKTTVRPGDRLAVAVVLWHAPGFHSWPNRPVVPQQFEGLVRPIATTIEVPSIPVSVEALPIQWPQPVEVTVNYTGSPIQLVSYVGTAVAYLPLQVAEGAEPGEVVLELAVRYQTCDHRYCYPPRTAALTVPLVVAAADAVVTAEPNEPELFTDFSFGEAAERSLRSALPSLTMRVFAWSFELDANGPVGLTLLLVLAALGGLILNVTPCVLPVIPLKIMGLSRAAGQPARLFLLGLVMSAGVVAFWIVLGGAIAFISGFDAISSLFQTGWFALAVGVIVAIMALGMMGLFSARLPQAVYRIDPDRETVPGSFGLGVMTAVLSTPCTAPFMGGASAWAATQTPAIALATFGAIGAGMALPYLVLAARPGLVKKVPRSGPWSVLVKQVIGLLMLAVAVFFIGTWLSVALAEPPEPPSRAFWWGVAGCVAAACAWLAYRTFALTASTARRAVVAAIALLFAVTGLSLARGLSSHGPIDWIHYTPERFAEAVRRGDVIVLDFTAEWCLNCKALETGVLHQEEIVELLARPEVVPIKVDLTTDNPPGKAKLAELRWVGIPLLAIYGPAAGYEEPFKFDSYTIGMVREAVVRARGD